MSRPATRVGRVSALAPSDELQPPREFFARDVVEVARDLIGAGLFVDGVGGIVVETEAYDRDDPASHSFRGPTARNAAMFGRPGHAYVYRIYGAHWCLNFVCGTEQSGSAVLIRAIKPQAGLDLMEARRGVTDIGLLCAGPGRLCQALAIGGELDGAPLDRPPFLITKPTNAHPIVTGTRIGIRRAAETAWRFGLANSPFVSRPFRA